MRIFSKDEYRIAKNVLRGFEQLTVAGKWCSWTALQ